MLTIKTEYLNLQRYKNGNIIKVFLKLQFIMLNMNIIYKVINIVFAIYFTLIIKSIFLNAEYFMINDTEFFRIFTIITLICMWLPIFIKFNIFINALFIGVFVIYFLLYIAHPLL